jgi:hypothetical protein
MHENDFAPLTYKSLPFRQEKQKINAEVAEVVEKSLSKAKNPLLPLLPLR